MELLICGAVIALVAFLVGAGTVGATLVAQSMLGSASKEEVE